MNALFRVLFGLLFVVGVIVSMVLLYLKVLPKKLDGTFRGKLAQFLHDYFNFKKLYVESVLKFFFALVTVVCVVGGIVGIISAVLNFLVGIVSAVNYGGWYFQYVLQSLLISMLVSLALLVLGPVVIRLVYEFTMMFVLLVKNVIEINNKTKAESNVAPASDDVQAPAARVEELPVTAQILE